MKIIIFNIENINNIENIKENNKEKIRRKR